NSLLVIAGDVFEYKSYMHSDDIHIFKNICKKLKENNIKCIIIPGNHDYNVNSELTKDKISLLIDEFPNIKCFNETVVVTDPFGFSELEFYIFSPIDKKIPEIKNNNNKKIAILHETIKTSVFYNGITSNNGRFEKKELGDFDIVMLGDVHKPQFLTDKIAYCGSFVQKNKGEGLDHGYILWDMKTLKGTIVFIPLKEVYITLNAENNQCIFPDLENFQKVKYVSFVYNNCSQEFLEKTKEEIKNKYGIINRTTTSFSKVEIQKKHTEKINHEKIIKGLLEKNGLEDMSEKILEYHNSKISSIREINYTNYTLNYMKWNNIFCYGKGNYIDFKDFQNDIVILNGKNKQGKSAVIDILLLILFNKQIRGNKQDIVNKNEKNGDIELSFSIGDNEYVVQRTILVSDKNTQHLLLKNGENITKDTITQTYTYIKKDLGIG
ncbi:MAG: AAA family ATPase, partial [Nanoarchaeota archaeon]